MPHRIPTRRDINIHDSLDERVAERNFFGKDLQQAEAMIRGRLDVYAEDLMWMGPAAFCFYVEAAAVYLLDPTATVDDDELDSFCCAAAFQAEHHLAAIESVRPRLLEVIRKTLGEATARRSKLDDGGELERQYRELQLRLLSITP